MNTNDIKNRFTENGYKREISKLRARNSELSVQIKKISSMNEDKINQLADEKINKINQLHIKEIKQLKENHKKELKELKEKHAEEINALSEKANKLALDNKRMSKQIEDLENKINNIVKDAVEKVSEEIVNKYEGIIKEKDQEIFKLKTKLNINSETSSLSSGNNPIFYEKEKICNSREKTDKPKGGQKGHKKHSLEHFEDEEVDEVITHKVDKCPKCGSTNRIVINTKVRDEINIKVEVINTRHNFPVCKCCNCGYEYHENIPENLHADNQYGSSVKALALSILDVGFVSFNRTRELIRGMTHNEIDISEGYLVKLQKKSGNNLDTFISDLKVELLKVKLLHWDDTVISIADKDKACLRAYTDGLFVLYVAHMAKDVEGMDEDGILQNLTSDTTVMHDHLLHNYCDEYSYENIECNAHITRKLKGITVNTLHGWAGEMKDLLEDTLAKRKELQKNNIDKFDDNFIEEFDRKYDNAIEKGKMESEEFKHKYDYAKEDNLLEFMEKFKSEITRWVRDFTLPYSNNLCESLLRMMKSKMKISYRFNSYESAKAFANRSSYIKTCKNFGIDRYDAYTRLCDGNPYTVNELLDLYNNKNSQ